MLEKMLFTSESVSEGHPDKVADQISDSVLDACLKEDLKSRVACEVLVTGNTVIVSGEITSKSNINITNIVKTVLKDVGYDRPELICDYHTVKVINLLQKQSIDISRGVSQKDPEDVGAGDQGIMFGYADKETKGYMPLAISIAHKLVRVASLLRKQGKFRYARPDMKSQVTIDYSGETPRIDTILMSIQHEPDFDEKAFKTFIKNNIMDEVVKSFELNLDYKVLINPTGRFVIGGPAGDTGLTGRKIIVDTYGGYAPHGGGAFSGKDPTKVDRTGAYMARYIAKNLVAAGVADKILIQLSYAIGINRPISICVEDYKTSKYSVATILEIINKVFDCRPGMIVKNFSLTNPSFKYHELTNYGHLGRNDIDLPWEKLDKVDAIKRFIKKNKNY